MIGAVISASVVYLDSAPLIYYIQEHKKFFGIVRPIIETIDRGEKRGISSYLTLLELLIWPFKKNRPDLAEQYRRLLLKSSHLRIVPMDESIATEAARIRAAYNFRTPDAIQLASAKISRADIFLTNDKRLLPFKEIPVVLLERIGRAR